MTLNESTWPRRQRSHLEPRFPNRVGHRSRPTIPTSMIDRRRNLQHYPEPGPGSKTPRIATSLWRSKQPSGYGREYWLQT